MGYGYDENQMPDGTTLNRDDLDKDFPDNPVMVIHISLHGAVLNSAALKKFGISAIKLLPPQAELLYANPAPTNLMD